MGLYLSALSNCLSACSQRAVIVFSVVSVGIKLAHRLLSTFLPFFPLLKIQLRDLDERGARPPNELWFTESSKICTSGHVCIITFVFLPCKFTVQEHTRSSAVAEGPRDVHVIVKFSYVVTEYG